MPTTDYTSADGIAAELAAIKRLLLRLLKQQQKTNPTGDLSISKWCLKRGVSRGHYYNLKARGRAPKTIGEGHATRITPAADQEWEAAEAELAATSKKEIA